MDTYLRIDPDGMRAWGAPSSPRDLLFVDLARGASVAELRHAPHDLFRSPTLAGVIMRDGNASARRRRAAWLRPRLLNATSPEELQELVVLSGLEAESGLLTQEPGRDPRMDGRLDVRSVPDLFARARAIELEALLEWGEAVWRPQGFHYRLPSGEHAAEFVRLADAIRHPRDAEVLASWLHPHLVDGVGVVLDSSTLTAIAEAASAHAAAAGLTLGPMVVLDGYPATGLEFRRAMNAALAGHDAGRVMAIVSVSSSGTVTSRIAEAMSAMGPRLLKGAVEVMVSKRPTSAFREELGSHISLTTWLPRPNQPPPAGYVSSGSAEGCRLCRDPQTTRLVPIDPVSFDGSLDLAHRTIFPSVGDADANRALWEHTDRLDALRLEVPPHPAVEQYRPSRELMNIRIESSALVADPSFRTSVSRAWSQSLSEMPAEARNDFGDFELLLVPDHELLMVGMEDLIRDMRGLIGQPVTSSFPLGGAWPDEVVQTVLRSERIAILSVGAVTGGTLQQGLLAVQRIRRAGPLVCGFVIHARLAEYRAWKDLRNSYAGRLISAWQSYVPLRSPLREELATLDFTPIEGLTEEALAFREARFLVCGGDLTRPDVGLFWGSRPDDRVSPNSIFGEHLRGPALFLAVGAAMDRPRKDAERSRTAPERRVFDIRSITRSYYDPLILAAMFRWLHPYEAWWGWHESDAATTTHNILERSRRLDDARLLAILTSELLLASAQGKVPPSGARVVVAFARTVVRGLDPAELGPIELGLAAAEAALGSVLQHAPEAGTVIQSPLV